MREPGRVEDDESELKSTLRGAVSSRFALTLRPHAVSPLPADRSQTPTDTGPTDTGRTDGDRHVASRGAPEIHMARVHGAGRGPAWESVQISAEGALRFCPLGSNPQPDGTSRTFHHLTRVKSVLLYSI